MRLHAMLTSDTIEGPAFVGTQRAKSTVEEGIFPLHHPPVATLRSLIARQAGTIGESGVTLAKAIAAPLRRAETWSVALVAVVCYGLFTLVAWNLRSDKLP